MKVSVIMSVYNAEKYVSEAINSILNQSYRDFELIIVEDFSNDATVEKIQEIKDKRITLIVNNENKGLTKNLNYAISIAKGDFIARMDADDISIYNRLERQVEFLDKNPEIGVLGTNAKEFGDSNNTIKWPAQHESIKATMLINNPILHSSVMIRSSILKENLYNSSFRTAQDYELWSRLIWITKFSNLQEVLIKYRIHKHQITVTKEIEQKKIADISRLRMLHSLKKLDEKSEKIFLSSCLAEPNFTNNEIIQLKYVYKDILQANNKLNTFNNKRIKMELSKNYDRVVYTYTRTKKSKYNLKLLNGLSREFNKYKIKKYLGPFYGILIRKYES